jgi:hypothetical protein
MKLGIALLCVVGAFALAGCSGSEISEEDMKAQKKEFSAENMEKAMKEAGKGQEWEDYKKREAERNRQSGGQDAEQH